MKNWTLAKSKTTPLDQYMNFVKEEKRQASCWKYFALISFGCLLISLAVLVYAVKLPKAFPLVITVSDWGEAKYVGEVSNYSYNGIKVPEIAINYQLRKFIINRFSIPFTQQNKPRYGTHRCEDCPNGKYDFFQLATQHLLYPCIYCLSKSTYRPAKKPPCKNRLP